MDLTKVLSELSNLLDNEIITEKEVEQKLQRVVMRMAARSEFTGPEFNLISELDFPSLFEDVKESLFEIPHSITSPHFSERFEIDGTVFCHIHTCKPDAENVQRALDNYRKAEEFLELLPKLKKITDNFFQGYTMKGDVIREYTKDKHTSWVFYSTMDDVFEDLDYHLKLAKKCNGRYCVVVPVERSPKNFINFYRRHSEDAKKAGLRIWVANHKSLTIDPYIGYPKDLRLIKNFKNPRVASMISSFWRAEVKDID
ncbi:MAG: hypothetical protein H0Z28_06615 [Archaeoglobus sp.]|nr:hypothetical protein [Archaeoglobus sp.]